jgi:hypothetical protein
VGSHYGKCSLPDRLVDGPFAKRQLLLMNHRDGIGLGCGRRPGCDNIRLRALAHVKIATYMSPPRSIPGVRSLAFPGFVGGALSFAFVQAFAQFSRQ